MKFQALGSLAVERDGTFIDLGARQQRALLAVLLVHANELLPVERILEALWGDDAEGKENALRVHVSRLRTALEPDRARGDSSVLETVDAAYRLNVGADQFDVTMFEDRAAQGRQLLSDDPAGASELLESALALWTGAAFEEFGYEDFAQSEIARLSDIRVDALEDRIEADLARGLAGEVVSELEVLRDQHPLRERLVRHQALALYRSGRPAEALRAIDRFRRHVGDELGIDPSPLLMRLEEQVLLHDQRIQPRQTAPEDLGESKNEASNPFKGLRAFGTDDAASFFGRDALVAELLRSIGGGQRLISVVGASGSGKSSVIRAGLIPALAKGVIEGSDRWLTATMLPGAHPFAELEAALLRSTLDGPDSLSDQLQDDDAGLLRSALRILPDDQSRVVLIIDQFEELFTLGAPTEVVDRFLSNLVTAVDDPHGRVTVIVTLRADFYAQPLTHPAFGARLGSGIVNVTPLTAEELEEAALRPAAEVGVSFEPALLGQLIADVGNQPGALPLFQYALTELFDRRASDTLTASTYRSMGGLEGAIERRASNLFEQLDEDQQDAARQLFLRLVAVSSDDQRTRRRVPAREIATLASDTVTMQHVIGEFGDHRLLSFDSDRLTGSPTVEVAHEALLTAWPTLEHWIEVGRDDLRQHGSLATAVLEWQLTNENPDYLLSESRLGVFDAWLDSSLMHLNTQEQRFLAASRTKLVERQADEAQRRENETRSRRRLWATIAALAASLGIAALFLFGLFGPGDEPVVTFFGDRNGPAVSGAIASGLDRADRELAMTLVDSARRGAEAEGQLRELVETGPEIIIGEGLGVGDGSIFVDYPDIQFGFVNEFNSGPNVTTISFENQEGAFLAGVAAALETETGIVGFIGASRLPPIEEAQAGFEAGARAVDPDISILVAYVRQADEISVDASFARPDIGRARAAALYERDADVIFAYAGFSGMGMFEAAVEQSAITGRHLWSIGVDSDEWFDVRQEQRPHVLTSVIKRLDLAAFMLAEHMITGGPAGEAGNLGLANGGFTYATSGNNLAAQTIQALDEYIDEITEQRIRIPVRPDVEPLLLDLDGNDIGELEPVQPVPFLSVDGLIPRELVEPGTYDLMALGTPLSVTLDGTLITTENSAGFTSFAHPDTVQLSDRDVTFLRPQLLTDPSQPQAAAEAQIWWPLDDIEGWLDNIVDGIVTSGPEATEIGGRPAIYFEAEIRDPEVCGNFGFCVAFIGTQRHDSGTITGFSFLPGFHSRVWWVDQGDQPPLAIIAATPSDDRSFQTNADELLATLTIGEPEPHPIGDLLPPPTD